MIPKECKRLAEVDFPIAEVSRHSAREKSIRHGHPSTLHLWWARRPLAACRAMLMALLLPDPCDDYCPENFIIEARKMLLAHHGRPAKWEELVATNRGLRKILLHFIADFANWDNSANPAYLETSRALVKAAHPDEPPLVVDPFAGGGSIPLEALRLGCEAFASDLNPVACLILKVMLQDIPRHGPKLAEELRRVGKDIKEKAEKELAEFYPTDQDDSTPIAYLWARTVRCESPNCGAEIPLARSFWLCKKANRKWALRYNILRLGNELPRVEFEIFEPKTDKEVPRGTVTRAKALCPACGTVLPPDRVRMQLAQQRGGADTVFDSSGNRTGGARMLAVITLKRGEQGRHYRLPTDVDYRAVWKAVQRTKFILDEWEKCGQQGLRPVPNESTPAGGGSGAGRAFSVQKYGIMTFGDLFTARQQLGLIRIGNYAREESHQGPIVQPLSLAMSRCTDQMSSLVRWRTTVEAVAGTFGRNALPMIWDFIEIVPTGDRGSNFLAAVEWVAEVVNALGSCAYAPGQVEVADAIKSPLPNESVGVWFTDPPYYDAIPYSDLSDFFLVWMKRVLPDSPTLKDPFDPSNSLSPKMQEAVQDEIRIVDGRPKDRYFFEEVMAKAFVEGRRLLQEQGIGSVVFAHKTTEGWEALLGGMIRGGWTITASWPIATERPGRLRSQESAALATSVHLVCRPRPEEASVGDWADILKELPKRVGDWMERLQSERVRGADMVFACIGPALEIFSRYSKVETAEGLEVKLAEYLEKVWEVVGRTALEQVLGTKEAGARNGVAGALEEDARLTALFLWTLQSTNGEATPSNGADEAEEDETDDDEEEETAPKGKAKGYTLVFDVVRRFAQPLGIDLPKWEDRVIKTEKGVVRLISVSDRSKQLFGEKGMKPVVEEIESSKVDTGQLLLPGLEEFAVSKAPKKSRGKRVKFAVDDPSEINVSATTLDRVHAAMLLQAGGQSNALRTFFKAEVERGPDFLRLANALSALYPKGSEEKRLLDAMLLAVPR